MLNLCGNQVKEDLKEPGLLSSDRNELEYLEYARGKIGSEE